MRDPVKSKEYPEKVLLNLLHKISSMDDKLLRDRENGNCQWPLLPPNPLIMSCSTARVNWLLNNVILLILLQGFNILFHLPAIFINTKCRQNNAY